jgi:hypothetical protein
MKRLIKRKRRKKNLQLKMIQMMARKRKRRKKMLRSSMIKRRRKNM